MLDKDGNAYVALSGEKEIYLNPGKANRHGLVTGATGTGKTVTLQNLAETFSAMGVPVFAADIKGDLSGVADKGGNKESVVKRVESYALVEKGFQFRKFPVQFWDIFGEQGTPVRATVDAMGAILLSRLLSLNETQSGVLSIIFKIAQDESLELIDLKDLQKIVEYIGFNARDYTLKYGNISVASIGAIQRGLLQLEQEGADKFFGEPPLNLDDLIQTNGKKGVINILAAEKLMNSPKVYTTFLLWMMTQLFETLPEIGDPEKPKLIFFFDEAHLLFNDAPKALLEKIEQLVRLIRSKGVGVYFVTQSPTDIPDSVLAQLGNRIQHALRAYTPKDQKAVKAAAQSFRANPKFDTGQAIMELETGEALVSFLDEKGAPNIVERAFILPPEGQIGPITPQERNAIVNSSDLNLYYIHAQDRESAYEALSDKLSRIRDEKTNAPQAKEEEKRRKQEEKEQQQASKQRTRVITSLASAVLVPLGRQLIRSFMKKKK